MKIERFDGGYHGYRICMEEDETLTIQMSNSKDMRLEHGDVMGNHRQTVITQYAVISDGEPRKVRRFNGN